MPGIEVQGTSLAPDSQPRKVWFTGFDNAETTAATSAPVIGGVVCFTENGGAVGNGVTSGFTGRGRGVDVTKPATAVLMNFAGIIVDMQQGMDALAVAGDGSGVPAGKAKPGWLVVVSAASAVQALTISNMTKPSTAIVPLGPANASWALKTITTSIASGALNIAALAGICGMALETVDTSGASEPGTLKWVKLGGIVGGLET